MENKKILLVGMIFVFMISFVSSANIGVSPAKIHYTDVLRGGYSERVVTITVDSPDPVQVDLSTRGEIDSWINYSEKSFKVSKDEPYKLIVSVSPPGDMPNGNYTGFLRLTTSQFGESVEGHATSIIRSALDLYLTVTVTDREFSSCNAMNFKVSDVEKGDPIIFTMDIENKGNIRIKPRITMDIWDQDQISIVKRADYSNTEIIPTKKESLVMQVPSNDLELGQYWVDVSAVDCYNTQTLTFDVLEPGALKADGELKRIDTINRVNVDDTTSIQAVFVNTGEKAVQAQFKGQINYGDKIIEILESDQALVPIGEENTFNLFFTPRNQGRYIVTGRVFYDGKRTFEKSALITAIKQGFSWSSVFIPLVYIVLIILISLLLYKIRKERKSYSLKIRGLKK